MFTGAVANAESTYCFIARDGMRDRIFLFKDKVSSDQDWERIRNGVRISFKIAFSMKGPLAFEVNII